MEIKSIEKFFLNTILTISIVGVLVVFVSDVLFFPEDTISISIDVSILAACSVAFLIRNQFPTVAVLVVTVTVLLAMIYQCLNVPTNTTTSLSIILVVGFIFSVMLKDKVMWAMHGITFIILNTVFYYQFNNPSLRPSEHSDDVITIAITYSILYFLLTYASAVLKSSYDRIHQNLRETNLELQQKANEIAIQNRDLEKIVDERTARIKTQNEILIKYSYTNAHHLRGPVARLLGLANVFKIQANPDPQYFIGMMVDQANEIDSVVKQINVDLALNNVEIQTEKPLIEESSTDSLGA